MIDDSEIFTKTWARNVDGIKKDGYSDGVLEGTNSTYQTSFDVGYAQGLEFGFKIGLRDTIKEINTDHNQQLSDTRRINCQICIGSDMERKDIGDLFNIQKEKNDAYLEKNSCCM